VRRGRRQPVADGGAVTTTTTDMAETTTTAAETAYFGNAEHPGEKVTITAVVDTDLTDESVVLDAGAYGDDYGLAESALFEVYANEEFLAAEEIVAGSPAPTS
jgi:hypothetical protein